jgi:hypothetical protein
MKKIDTDVQDKAQEMLFSLKEYLRDEGVDANSWLADNMGAKASNPAQGDAMPDNEDAEDGGDDEAAEGEDDGKAAKLAMAAAMMRKRMG